MVFPIKYHDIKVDDRKSTARFVEIRYKDKSPSDYGYYSVVSDYSTNTQNSKSITHSYNFPLLTSKVKQKEKHR